MFFEISQIEWDRVIEGGVIYMEDEKFYQSLSEIGNAQDLSEIYDRENDFAEKLNEHREWLRNIRHERPSTLKHFRVAIYIRYFNQTKHENYLDYQIKQFQSTLDLCPIWSLVLSIAPLVKSVCAFSSSDSTFPCRACRAFCLISVVHTAIIPGQFAA